MIPEGETPEQSKAELVKYFKNKVTSLVVLSNKVNTTFILDKSMVLDKVTESLNKNHALKFKGYYIEKDQVIRDPTPENLDKFKRYAEAASEDDPKFFKTVYRVWDQKDFDKNMDRKELKKFIEGINV